MASVLNQPYFSDEAAAFERLEAILWPNGPTCPHCGATDRIGKLAPQRTKASKKNPNGKPVLGLHKCYHCRSQFTVRVGTVFEASHVPLHIWFQASFLMVSSKKGISSNQLHRTLGVTLRTAWFMSMRLREAMRVLIPEPMGGDNKAVEVDETFVGPKAKNMHAVDRAKLHGRGAVDKEAVLSLVERGGKVRSHHVANVKAETLRPIMYAQIKRDTMLMTDDAHQYRAIGKGFKHHFAVEHSAGEYVRGGAHSNTIEGYFSILKRGLNGVYQHVSERHLKRYLAEFDFRYNEREALGVDDPKRMVAALAGISGKRLMYRDS